MERLLAGGAAGALSRVATAPIDRVKLLYQVNATATATLTPRTALTTAGRIVREEGAVALWRGTGAAVTRILPYSACTFATYPWYNDALAAAFVPSEPEGTLATRFAAGALAGATATFLTYPLDLIHARVTAHRTFAGPRAPAAPAGGRHPNSSAATPLTGGFAASVRNLASAVKLGGIRSAYAGLSPTLVGIVPYGGISFATFESVKALYHTRERKKRGPHHDWDEDDMPVTHKLIAGGVSGFVAQTATYPLHVVRRRMQVFQRTDPGANLNAPAANTPGPRGGFFPPSSSPPGPSPSLYPSIWEGLRRIYAAEGVANGLFKGVGLTWVKGPIAAAIGFTANDALKRFVPACRDRAARGEGVVDSRLLFGTTGTAADHHPPATYIEAKAQQATAIESLIAGGCAGAVAKTVIAPADRVKIIYQVDPDRRFTLRGALGTARSIVAAEGVAGLWRGNGVMMARVVPYAGVTFLAYPRYEAAFSNALEFGRGGGSEEGEGGGGGSREGRGSREGPPGSEGRGVDDGGGSRAGGGSRLGGSGLGGSSADSGGGGGVPSVASRFLAGAAAGATATTLTYPLDLMRARYAAGGAGGAFAEGPGIEAASAASASSSPRGSSTKPSSGPNPNRRGVSRVAADLVRVARAEGLRGLYGGVAPTLLGIVPYAGISFATFETLKARYRRATASRAEWGSGEEGSGEGSEGSSASALESRAEREMPASARLFFGGVAGLFAQSATYPLDIVRRRIQVAGGKGGSWGEGGIWRALVDIARKEGVAGGLYKGVAMNWVKGPASVAVSFYVNDWVKSRFGEWRERNEEETP